MLRIYLNDIKITNKFILHFFFLRSSLGGAGALGCGAIMMVSVIWVWTELGGFS